MQCVKVPEIIYGYGKIPKDCKILLQAVTMGKSKRPVGKQFTKAPMPLGASRSSVLFPEEVSERKGKTDVWPRWSIYWLHEVLRVVFMIILFPHHKSLCDLVVPRSLLMGRQLCRKTHHSRGFRHWMCYGNSVFGVTEKVWLIFPSAVTFPGITKRRKTPLAHFGGLSPPSGSTISGLSVRGSHSSGAWWKLRDNRKQRGAEN